MRRSAAPVRPTRASRSSARSRDSLPRMPCSTADRRISSRPVISGSSAASWRATPIARRTWLAAPHVARVDDDVVARDARGARGGAQQRREHPHGRGLARAVGAEEGVDLALVDVQVDALHGVDRVTEATPEVVAFDGGHVRPPTLPALSPRQRTRTAGPAAPPDFTR